MWDKSCPRSKKSFGRRILNGGCWRGMGCAAGRAAKSRNRPRTDKETRDFKHPPMLGSSGAGSPSAPRSFGAAGGGVEGGEIGTAGQPFSFKASQFQCPFRKYDNLINFMNPDRRPLMPPIVVVGLFCGQGGMDLAFHQDGFGTVWRLLPEPFECWEIALKLLHF